MENEASPDRRSEARAMFAKLPLGYKIRVIFSLYTNPSYLRLQASLLYGGLVIRFMRASLKATLFFVRLILSALRPNYRPYEVIVPSVAILVVGAVVSVHDNDWMWFARSGSLLVIVAALMHVFDAKSRVERAKNNGLALVEKFMDGLGERRSDKIDGMLVPLRRSAQALHHRLSRYDIERYSQTYKHYELLAALVGTFVWGFGDLIGRLL
jgi:hypothetical protein